MHSGNVYQPFVQIDANRLVFGVLVHHSNNLKRIELFSMEENNKKLFSQAMRFEGTKFHESNIDNILYSGALTSILTVSRSPSEVHLFSSNLYFEVSSRTADDAFNVILTGNELEREAHIDRDTARAQYVQPMRSLLKTLFVESDGVYMIFDHCLADFLNEADMEIKEYIARWNRNKEKNRELVFAN